MIVTGKGKVYINGEELGGCECSEIDIEPDRTNEDNIGINIKGKCIGNGTMERVIDEYDDLCIISSFDDKFEAVYLSSKITKRYWAIKAVTVNKEGKDETVTLLGMLEQMENEINNIPFGLRLGDKLIVNGRLLESYIEPTEKPVYLIKEIKWERILKEYGKTAERVRKERRF